MKNKVLAMFGVVAVINAMFAIALAHFYKNDLTVTQLIIFVLASYVMYFAMILEYSKAKETWGSNHFRVMISQMVGSVVLEIAVIKTCISIKSGFPLLVLLIVNSTFWVSTLFFLIELKQNIKSKIQKQ